ncbi:sulfate ABC transporter permease subunit CysT [Planctomicrobium piriforme]|uniref:Sulfate transport system permease protein CysT n=1 Tax=Planctomicrobium piriforme TaxID=1576369 RepID=A0A1I3F518_9PLAN|nr:sulfate transport system permease protein [Planctomicrobium piriforme]
MKRSPLPGFGLGLGVTVGYLSVLLLIPLAACLAKAATLTPKAFLAAVSSPQALAAYRVTFETSLAAAFISAAAGLLLAWVLVRYEFFGRRFLDALIDLPFALPTAVAGLVFSALFVQQGWYGQYLMPLGIKVAYTRLGIVLVLTFVGLPFVVRTVQPVLESMERDTEEAASSLGASRWQTFRWVLFPALWPSVLTGFALSFARGLGEYGSVMFISGNMPFKTEIAPVLIVAKLEQFSYAEATAIAIVLVGFSLVSLAAINWLERRSQRYAG